MSSSQRLLHAQRAPRQSGATLMAARCAAAALPNTIVTVCVYTPNDDCNDAAGAAITTPVNATMPICNDFMPVVYNFRHGTCHVFCRHDENSHGRTAKTATPAQGMLYFTMSAAGASCYTL
jgi:hypothetical protein